MFLFNSFLIDTIPKGIEGQMKSQPHVKGDLNRSTIEESLRSTNIAGSSTMHPGDLSASLVSNNTY
jgi:hypothetical protein